MSACPTPTDLCHALQQGQLCYISRITTKEQHSLCGCTRDEMAIRGYRTSIIRLSTLANRPHAQKEWDKHLIKELWYTFYPTNRARLSQWLGWARSLSPRERLIQFSNDLLLSELCDTPITILIDTLDTLTDHSGATSDLFAWIDYCYDLRDTYLSYHHLSFALFAQTDISRIGWPQAPRSIDNLANSSYLKLFRKPLCTADSPSSQLSHRPNSKRPTRSARFSPSIQRLAKTPFVSECVE